MSSDNDHVFGEDTGSDVFEIFFVKPDPDATEDAVEDIQEQREPKRVKKKQYDTIDAFMKGECSVSSFVSRFKKV